MYNIKIHIAGYLIQLSILQYNVYISFKKVKDYVNDKREYGMLSTLNSDTALHRGPGGVRAGSGRGPGGVRAGSG